MQNQKSSEKVLDITKNITIEEDVVTKDDKEQTDLKGLNQKDVESIVKLRKCKTSRAAMALRENNNDLFEAILSLTPGADSAYDYMDLRRKQRSE